MILENWRGYKIKILNRNNNYCKVELFHFNNQHFIIYSLNNNNLTDTEINNNIYKTIKKMDIKNNKLLTTLFIINIIIYSCLIIEYIKI